MEADLRFFVDESPAVEIDAHDLVHIIDRSGPTTIERVMSVASLIGYLQRGQRALADWRERQGGEGDG